MKITYKVVSEWSAPTYYDIDTNKKLCDECDASEQCLWIVSYDEDDDEIVEWLERFYVGEEEQARSRAEELIKERSE